MKEVDAEEQEKEAARQAVIEEQKRKEEEEIKLLEEAILFWDKYEKDLEIFYSAFRRQKNKMIMRLNT